jgi:glycosyltransferase involved in cell wall biosynthesis
MHEDCQNKAHKIGIDCRMWDETGIGRYIRNIVTRIAAEDSHNHYVLFFLPKDLGSQEFPSNFTKVGVDIRWHSFSEQIVLPWIYLKNNLDLLFVPHFNAPVLYPKKFVATIHDLTILRVRTGRATTLPYPIYLFKRLAFRLNVFNTVHRATALFTVSNFVKEDLIKTFNLNHAKKNIAITPNAAAAHFNFSPKTNSRTVLEKYSMKGSSPYIFYVGNAHPHKNLERLVEAFDLINNKRPDLYLVLGGKKEFFYERLERESAEKFPHLKEKIIFPGFIDDADLPSLYTQAAVFANPSLYEGFGIQLLEAFSCGTKVACSNTTSLPEVGGDLPFYFDPRDPADMADSLLKALETDIDPEILRARAGSYSWDDSARKILTNFNDVLK